MNNYLIGTRIRNAREEKNLTQEKLAELVELTPNAISNIENGTSCPNLKNIVAITEVLEISIDYLMAPQQNDKTEMYIHEIIVKLKSMEEWELEYFNKYINLWRYTLKNKENRVI